MRKTKNKGLVVAIMPAEGETVAIPASAQAIIFDGEKAAREFTQGKAVIMPAMLMGAREMRRQMRAAALEKLSDGEREALLGKQRRKRKSSAAATTESEAAAE